MSGGDGDFQRRLENEKLASLAELAAGAGHEINNPLAVIAGRAQLLLRSERDPTRRRELAVINAQAMRIHEMIADLMLFARPPRPRRAPCDLADLIKALADETRSKAAERQIELSVDLAAGPLAIDADAAQLAVALKAVVDNALDVLGPGGTVVIAARRTGEQGVEVLIRDNGPGISPDVRRHLFDPFFSGRPAGRGLGMGLAKCWRIVTNHGGEIDVESRLGHGAAFTIRLPGGAQATGLSSALRTQP